MNGGKELQSGKLLPASSLEVTRSGMIIGLGERTILEQRHSDAQERQPRRAGAIIANRALGITAAPGSRVEGRTGFQKGRPSRAARGALERTATQGSERHLGIQD